MRTAASAGRLRRHPAAITWNLRSVFVISRMHGVPPGDEERVARSPSIQVCRNTVKVKNLRITVLPRKDRF